MVQMSEYPDYKKPPTKQLTVSDFPRRAPSYSKSARHYLAQHHVFMEPLPESIYPTERGICYVMTGPVMCFQERITFQHWPMRFWSPAGSPLGRVLYVPAAHAKQKPVFVVEGLTDALCVWQSGYNAVSLVGAKVSEEQMTLLRTLGKTHKLILIPDNDEAGEQCGRTLQRELTITVKRLPSQYKDVCDLTSDYKATFLAGCVR